MTMLKGKAIVAQSGGPTAVINASVCGVVQTIHKHDKAITGIIGARNGILGILDETLFDLAREDPADIEKLKRTPAAALGSCRYKLQDLSASREDYERILDVFKAHDIRFFFYCGGNDSMDTADKVARLAAEMNYELIAIGVPKTVDNDLALTDHCPGYGSVAKYVATAVMEAGLDTEALASTDTCNVIEVMGRNAGWIAAAAGLAQRDEQDGPHLIYMPEVAFVSERFLADVREVVQRLGRCVIVAGEGIRDGQGRYLAEMGGQFADDSFGHAQLGGTAEVLRNLIEEEIGVKCRTNKLGLCQRSAMHWASRTDRDEAYRCGVAAVEAAIAGENRKMVTLIRAGTGPKDYTCTTGLADLDKVARGEKMVPRAWINAAGNHIEPPFRDYLHPLVQGQVEVDMADDGLPSYVRLERDLIPRRRPVRP